MYKGMCSGSWKKSPQTPKGPTSEVCRLRFPQLKSAGERERERERATWTRLLKRDDVIPSVNSVSVSNLRCIIQSVY